MLQTADHTNGAAADGRKYRFFADPGHGWLEVPLSEVVASGVQVSAYSYYDPLTDRVYLEEDRDAPQFLQAVGKDWGNVGRTLYSSAPRQLHHYGPETLAMFIGNMNGAKLDRAGEGVA